MAFVRGYHYDVFISYAHADNDPDLGDGLWVSTFKRKLQAALRQQLGGADDLAIFFDESSLNSNHQLDKLTAAARDCAVFLAIKSPSYAQRPWTRQELAAFIGTKPDLERLFSIECQPLEEGETYPSPLQNHTHLPFWQSHPRTAIPLTLSPIADKNEFDPLIQRLATNIRQQLRQLAAGQDSGADTITLSSTSYVPNVRHDVLISYAAEDEPWVQDLHTYLHKQLKQKLATAAGFTLSLAAGLDEADTAAVVLVVASPAYVRQYHPHDPALAQLVKTKAVLLAEYEPSKRLEALKGLSPNKFWLMDDSEGMVNMTGSAYYAVADKLAASLADAVKEQKKQAEHQQRVAQERAAQQSKVTAGSSAIDAFVFLHNAPEDLPLSAEIVLLLEENGVEYALPIKRHPQLSTGEIREDVENNIKSCDAVLLLYEQTTQAWAREQLLTCRRVQRYRDRRLKVIAVHKAQANPDLDIKLHNLKVYCCPPENIRDYLREFIADLV